MKEADVVCCTLTGVVDKALDYYMKVHMRDQLFDIGVIDECN